MRYSDLYYSSLKKIQAKNRSFDIQLLIEKAFYLSRTKYWIKKNEIIQDQTGLKRFYTYLNRLLRDEPVAYILKKKEFFSETFYVNKNVLIPRQETEILVQKAMDMIKSNDEVLDIGAGCGNISIILAKHTGIKVVAVEKCKKAIYVLKKNILLHNVKDKIIPVKADLFPVSPKKFNLIISNPPYVSEPEWKQLPPGIKKYEPRHALVAGAKGTEILDRIIKNAKTHLKSRGKLLIEIGYDQRSSVYKKLKDSDYSQVSFFYDLNNIPRVVLAQL